MMNPTIFEKSFNGVSYTHINPGNGINPVTIQILDGVYKGLNFTVENINVYTIHKAGKKDNNIKFDYTVNNIWDSYLHKIENNKIILTEEDINFFQDIVIHYMTSLERTE